MSALRPVEIVGGGLAGLSLGIALRRRGVPVALHDAGTYPRHRVCGEFIAGLDETTIATLGLTPYFEGARHHHDITWHGRGAARLRHRLPRKAFGLSRHTLDTRLAEAFVGAGGELFERSRVESARPQHGWVFATGRRREGHEWLGLKVHVRRLPLDGDLELHLGDQTYVGLAGVEDDKVNVCGLFRRRLVANASPNLLLDGYLRAAGLDLLANRLRAAETCSESRAAIAGLNFSMPSPQVDRVAIGDAFGAIPPFTGDGMAMAFQSAAIALPLLLDWSRGGREWGDVIRRLRVQLRRRFLRRLLLGRLLHPWLLAPARQRLLVHPQAQRWLPLRLLYHVLH